MMRRFLACIVAIAALTRVQEPQAQRQVPTFRGGVELMRIEASVLDRRTRTPIRGLTAADFIVKVNGQPQEIVTLIELIAPNVDRSAAAWTREAGSDVTTNREVPSDHSRLIVIVMDDMLPYTRRNDPFHRASAKTVAHRIVDEMGPYDRAAVLFAQQSQSAVDFTTDRTVLRKAIDSYNPWPVDEWLSLRMSTGILTRAGAFLAGLPERRRAIFYITPSAAGQPDDQPMNWHVDVSQQTDVARHQDIAQREAAAAVASSIRSAFETSRLAHVPVFPISTRGVVAPDAAEIKAGLYPAVTFDGLRTIANQSGGRAVVGTNTPERQVASIFHELSSSYLLAYAPAFPMDGKARNIEVTVTRPDAVVAPNGRVTFVTPRAPGAGLSAMRAPRASALLEAIAAPLPGGSVPMQLSVAPFALPTSAEGPAAVVMTVGVSLDHVETPEQPVRVDLEGRIFDGVGRKQMAELKQTALLAPRAGYEWPYDVVFRHDLPPGRYHVRIAAAVGDRTGSVFTTFTVPRFDADQISMSGVAIGRIGGVPASGRAVLQDLLPFAPTVARVFQTQDIVGVLARVHQAGNRMASVTVNTRIVDRAGVVVLDRDARHPAAAFSSGPVNHQFDLPVRDLAQGDYLLTFTAKTERGATASREVRFSVR